MDITIRGSEYNSFLTCRKQWLYQWVQDLEPKKPDKKLFIGTLFHKWLENYYNNSCERLVADLKTSVWLNEQDLSEMEQTEIDEILHLARGMADYYNKTYVENDKQFNVIATEMEFLVHLQDGLSMTGTIDLVYEVDGKIRFMDHKTVSSLQMYEDKSKMDRQISRYWWALKMIAQGIGRVKDKETDTWVRSIALEGKEIDGFDYNLIAKDFPKEPKVLKNGKLSTDKNQKTTFDLYIKKIAETNQEMYLTDYNEMLEYLKDKPNQFLKRIDVKRTQAELESAAWEFLYTCGDIHDIKLTIQQNPSDQVIEQLTYRHIGTHCQNMCQFKSLCQTAIEGGNVALVKNLTYRKREE